MKTMKKGRVIKRVSEDRVPFYVDEGWKFCSKEEWKEKVRDKVVSVKKTKKQICGKRRNRWTRTKSLKS
jgi:hypothetical protein